ncbi:MAG: HNH endonuclease signature motif containing protein, partial [Geodermatophilaceae bacterium]
MAALTRARDRTCRWYGCRQPAARADLDHTTPYPHGPTATTNLAALCRAHHRLTTHTSWHVRQHDDARMSYTSPTGQHIDTEPWPHDLHPPP